MEEISTSEDLIINPQDIEELVTEVIEDVLLNVTYDDNLVGVWIDSIQEQVMKRLYDLHRPYKYCITCFIMQKTGAAVMTTWSQWIDSGNDVPMHIQWPKDKAKDANKTLVCFVLVNCVGF